MTRSVPLVVNGWNLLAHPLFQAQFESLVKKVEKLKQKNAHTYKEKNITKRLAAINKLIFDVIPQDPTLRDYWQGQTLGNKHSHWFRAQFFQQYRLFFRFHVKSKIIIYAWVNDEKTKRAYDSKSDAYAVFKKMLHQGNPPSTWEQLLKEAINLKYVESQN